MGQAEHNPITIHDCRKMLLVGLEPKTFSQRSGAATTEALGCWLGFNIFYGNDKHISCLYGAFKFTKKTKKKLMMSS